MAVKGVLPLLLLAALLVLFAQVGPIGVFRAAFPPIEELTFERIAFPQAGLIRVHLVNGGLRVGWVDFRRAIGAPTMPRGIARGKALPNPAVPGQIGAQNSAEASDMRWARIELDGAAVYGIVEGDEIETVAGDPFDGYEPTGTKLSLDAVKLLVPVVPKTFYAAGTRSPVAAPS